ncbi:hypothetical protein [Saccharolobus islandicus]|uniref:Uncharacterized protein n=2 Tax=Saccharolobus islandicus TaxID=43080 RepID=C3MWM3_SACI4|nr:hypothetical protein [Sulfolobus islandicus]ACP37681.1 hypothetical protein M1425_0885 [Sulfolobus islandicus M.14.25]ACP54876.1 hypothetical protein M1627_0950 [Sulfolobus islandicus M.16.27]
MRKVTFGNVYVIPSDTAITDGGNLVISLVNARIQIHFNVFPYSPSREAITMNAEDLSMLIKNLEHLLNTTARIKDYGQNLLLRLVLERLI